MTFKIAAVQATPVFLDRDATIARACELIAELGEAGPASSSSPRPSSRPTRIGCGAYRLAGTGCSPTPMRSCSSNRSRSGPVTDRLCEAANKPASTW